jgi:hypothetical protein
MRAFASALVLACAVALPAQAQALEFSAREVGVAKTVRFGGELDGRPVEGLSATLTVRLLSAEAGTFRFAYTFKNTSGAPFTRARASLWGFDIPEIDHATSTRPFRFMGTGETAGYGHRDVCFGSKIHDDCREGDGGVALGKTGSGTFAFGGAKSGRVRMTDLFVRWTDLDAPKLGLKNGKTLGQETR